MKTIQLETYTFNELSEQAKQNAIENYRNSNIDYSCESAMFKEGCEDRLKENGFINPEISFSLSYCQGDGLSFKADGYSKIYDIILSFMPHKPKTAQLLADNITVNYKGNTGRYCYALESQVTAELDYYSCNGTDNMDAIAERLENVLRDEYMQLCKDLEDQGYKYFESLTSDEYITEHFVENEVDFLEDGTIY